MILVLFGPPGSGKGTQSEFIRVEYGFEHFSTGALFREIVSDPKYKNLADLIASGGLVPDEIVTELVFAKISDIFVNGEVNLLLDGFPRSLPQAESLRSFVAEKLHTDLFFIFIDIPNPEKVLVDRLLDRVTCKSCGAPFNKSSCHDTIKCPFCGSEDYFRRADDNETSVKERIVNYKKVSSELIKSFSEKNLFIIDGNSDISTVRDRVFAIINMLVKERV